ncbi:putative membrane protein [Treponema pallidum subsp. pertenue]|nr:putative membrane protein [Treponema pallidum subsp. pertenue]WGK73128.1 putative membrane protein [Treponema pallidum subsp. pertenue]WGK77994.1 putative membrane protein [Treponema pallidum subsp. pertenue]
MGGWCEGEVMCRLRRSVAGGGCALFGGVVGSLH